MPSPHGRYWIDRKAHLPADRGGCPFWNEARVFSRWEAWQDLIQLAAYADHERVVDGQLIAVARGEIVASIRYLARRWTWSKSRVSRFVRTLKDMDRIAGHQANGKRDTYMLVNYERYQALWDTNGTPASTRAGHARDTRGTKRSKEKEGEGRTSTPLSLDLPVETTPARDNGVGEVWQAYLAARDDYHQATSGRSYGAPALTEKRRKLIKRRLKEYPPDDLMAAVRGIFQSPHNRGNNDRGEEYLGIEIALRVNQDRNNVERFRDLWRRCSADERRGKRIEAGALSPDGALRMGEDGQWEPVGGAPS